MYNDRDFCQQSISQVYPGLQLSHSDQPEKNFRFRAKGHFRGSPLFLAILGLCHFRGISTLSFGPISTKLGGTVRAIEKMTQNDNRPGLGWNYGETDIFTFCRKVVFWPKIGFNPKNHPKFLKTLISIWEKATFFFEQLFLVLARTWLGSRSGGLYLGPKSRFLA